MNRPYNKIWNFNVNVVGATGRSPLHCLNKKGRVCPINQAAKIAGTRPKKSKMHVWSLLR